MGNMQMGERQVASGIGSGNGKGDEKWAIGNEQQTIGNARQG
jgi:hypothetical protein